MQREGCGAQRGGATGERREGRGERSRGERGEEQRREGRGAEERGKRSSVTVDVFTTGCPGDLGGLRSNKSILRRVIRKTNAFFPTVSHGGIIVLVSSGTGC